MSLAFCLVGLWAGYREAPVVFNMFGVKRLHRPVVVVVSPSSLNKAKPFVSSQALSLVVFALNLISIIYDQILLQASLPHC